MGNDTPFDEHQNQGVQDNGSEGERRVRIEQLDLLGTDCRGPLARSVHCETTHPRLLSHLQYRLENSQAWTRTLGSH